MTYTDGVHLVADSLDELHTFAASVGLGRKYYHGIRKGHPHYDLITAETKMKALSAGAMMVRPREVLLKSKEMLTRRRG